MPIQHPPLQPGWIDRPHEVLPLGDFVLESGQTIREFGLSYVMHGAPDARRSNVVLALCAIGSTHHRLDAWIVRAGRWIRSGCASCAWMRSATA